MRRVVIMGNAGSGKSTLARRLSERLGLPVAHLDKLFWRAGWVEAPVEDFRAAVAEVTAGEAWVTDGNYVSKTFALRLPRAELAVFLDRPRLTCLWRVTWRALTYRQGTRPDMAEGCDENFDLKFLTFIWNFDRNHRQRILGAIAAHRLPWVRLTSDAQVARFLADPAAYPREAA